MIWRELTHFVGAVNYVGLPSQILKRIINKCSACLQEALLRSASICFSPTLPPSSPSTKALAQFPSESQPAPAWLSEREVDAESKTEGLADPFVVLVPAGASVSQLGEPQ